MHSDVKRYYAVLALDPSASDDELRLAFRRRAKELHPDSPTGDAEAFIWLKRAYDTLSDPTQRARYDHACRAVPDPPPPPRPHRWAQPRPPMPHHRAGSRRGGGGRARYVVAFVLVAAISIGGVEAMISFMEAPPSIQTRNTPRAETPAPPPTETVAEGPKAPGSSKSGFWDPTPAPSRKE